MVKKKKTVKNNESAQPDVNIGIVGHVDHGKTTLLERLSGKWADTHSEEIKRGITIRLGYADVEIRKAEDGTLTTDKKAPELVRKVSFVDAPGHESLMATMLAGATIMDGALLLVSANEQVPQAQTQEHVTALQIIGINNVIVVQNKIDLVSEEQALNNYKQIKKFLSKTPYKDAPIIPISAQHQVNIDYLLQAIQDHIPPVKRDEKKDPVMLVARSFDINKPGSMPAKMVGGVLGGTITQGILKVGDTIEIRPGREVKEKNQSVYKPIQTKITGLNSGGTVLEELHPGGSVGVMTALDPSVVKSDKLTGAVVGKPGTLPPVWNQFTLKITLLDRAMGGDAVGPIKAGEPLMLNVSTAATVGMVTEQKKGRTKCVLRIPVCASTDARITISRRVGNRFRLIGYGEIQK